MAMLTEAEVAAMRARDAEDMPAVRSERLQPTNVWSDRHRLLAHADALTAALAAERGQRAEREAMLMDDIRRTADYWIEALSAEGKRLAAERELGDAMAYALMEATIDTMGVSPGIVEGLLARHRAARREGG